MDIITDNYLDRLISENLAKAQEEESSTRTPSGKLSASKLYWPLQWQILSTQFGLKSSFDDYTLRKFKRGKDVEDWFMSQVNPVEKQKFLEYRGVIGYCDSIVDTKDWDNNYGVIPLECKSITNMAFKWLDKEGAKKGHIAQNALYALALKAKHHAISYIASDDYRIQTYILDTKDSKVEIDLIIDEFEKAVASKTIPKFEVREKWQADIKYNNFPEFAGMSEEELQIKYNELKNG